MNLEDLICTGITMLLGEEDKFWLFYETDPAWWAVHLWTKRN